MNRDSKNSSECNPFWLFPPNLAQEELNCLFVLDSHALIAPYNLPDWESEIEGVLRTLANEDRLFVSQHSLYQSSQERTSLLKVNYQRLLLWKQRIERPLQEHGNEFPLLRFSPELSDVMTTWANLSTATRTYIDSLDSALRRIQKWSWTDSITSLYRDLFSSERIIQHQPSSPQGPSNSADENSRSLVEFTDRHLNMLWRSLLSFSTERGKSIVLVTSVHNEEWIVSMEGTAFGIRPELFYEFKQATKQNLYAVSFSQFLAIHSVPKEVIIDSELFEYDEYSIPKDLYQTRGDVKKVMLNLITCVKGVVSDIRELDLDAILTTQKTLNRLIIQLEEVQLSLKENRESVYGLEKVDRLMDAAQQVSHYCHELQQQVDDDPETPNYEPTLELLEWECYQLLGLNGEPDHS